MITSSQVGVAVGSMSGGPMQPPELRLIRKRSPSQVTDSARLVPRAANSFFVRRSRRNRLFPWPEPSLVRAKNTLRPTTLGVTSWPKFAPPLPT